MPALTSLAGAAAAASIQAIRAALPFNTAPSVAGDGDQPASSPRLPVAPSSGDQRFAESATRMIPPSETIAYTSMAAAVAQGFLISLITPGAGRGQYVNLLA